MFPEVGGKLPASRTNKPRILTRQNGQLHEGSRSLKASDSYQFVFGSAHLSPIFTNSRYYMKAGSAKPSVLQITSILDDSAPSHYVQCQHSVPMQEVVFPIWSESDSVGVEVRGNGWACHTSNFLFRRPVWCHRPADSHPFFFYLPLTKFFGCLALTVPSPSLACFRKVCFGLGNLMSPCWCHG